MHTASYVHGNVFRDACPISASAVVAFSACPVVTVATQPPRPSGQRETPRTPDGTSNTSASGYPRKSQSSWLDALAGRLAGPRGCRHRRPAPGRDRCLSGRQAGESGARLWLSRKGMRVGRARRRRRRACSDTSRQQRGEGSLQRGSRSQQRAGPRPRKLKEGDALPEQALADHAGPRPGHPRRRAERSLAP